MLRLMTYRYREQGQRITIEEGSFIAVNKLHTGEFGNSGWGSRRWEDCGRAREIGNKVLKE